MLRGEPGGQAMAAGDAGARWIMQAWLFYNEKDFWQAPQIQARAVPPLAGSLARRGVLCQEASGSIYGSTHCPLSCYASLAADPGKRPPPASSLVGGRPTITDLWAAFMYQPPLYDIVWSLLLLQVLDAQRKCLSEADSRHTRPVACCHWLHVTHLVCRVNLHPRLRPLRWGGRALGRAA